MELAISRLAQKERFESLEGDGAVGHGQLLFRLHLAEGLGLAFRHEDRIIAKALVASRRPDQLAANDAFEAFDVSVRPGEREHTDETCTAVDFAIRRSLRLEAVLDLLHGDAEILVRPGPARRVNARRSCESVAGKP